MAFKTVTALENFLNRKLEKTLKDIRFEAFKIIEGYLHDFYNEYDPFSYDRTERLMSSLIVGDIVKTANGYSTVIYFNVDALHYPNAGISDSQIVDIVMNSNMPHGGYAEGTPIWVSSEQKLKAELIEKMKSALIANGIPIK